jgi:hypothetical protein
MTRWVMGDGADLALGRLHDLDEIYVAQAINPGDSEARRVAIEAGVLNEDGSIGGYKEKNCRYCGEHPLWWRLKNQKWRLVGSESIVHTCKEYAEQESRRREDDYYRDL